MSLRGHVCPTDQSWFAFLRALAPPPDEVNFWFPSGRTPFRGLEPGAPFFFKLKKPLDCIGGFGIFASFSAMRVRDAWSLFGAKNGCATFDAFRQALGKYSGGPVGPNHVVGCVVLVTPRFFPDDAWYPRPSTYAKNLTRGRGYDLGEGEGLAMFMEAMARSQAASATPQQDVLVVDPAYGKPRLVAPRLGQGSFQVAVGEAYHWACAVTSEHSRPAVEACHIRPFSEGGPMSVSNGLALRADIHRLFDEGYVTVTPAGHFEVSHHLYEDFGNGRSYKALHGRAVLAPERPDLKPSPAQLAWHNENRYLG